VVMSELRSVDVVGRLYRQSKLKHKYRQHSDGDE